MYYVIQREILGISTTTGERVYGDWKAIAECHTLVRANEQMHWMQDQPMWRDTELAVVERSSSLLPEKMASAS